VAPIGPFSRSAGLGHGSSGLFLEPSSDRRWPRRPPRAGTTCCWGSRAWGYACLTFVWFSVAAFLPVLTTDLGLSGTDAGLLTGIIPLVYVPFSLASGLAIDRIGAPRAIAAGLLLFGLAQLARGFAPGFPTLLALTGLVGIGGTAITFGLPKLVAERFTPTRSGTLSSVYLLGSYLGIPAAFGLGRAILGPCSGAGGRSFAGAGSLY